MNNRTCGVAWLRTVLMMGGVLLSQLPAAVAGAWLGPGPAAGRLPLVIGHAGSGFIHLFNSLPPSSLRSLRRALCHGADGVEVDVRLSQDSIPVLYHDHTLDSMTDGTGCVSQTPAALLTQLHYRVNWPHNWLQHERPTTLEAWLTELARRPTFPYLHLDLHEDDACSSGEAARSQALARQLAALLTRYRVPADRVLVLTNRPATLRYLRQLLPTVPLGYEFTGEFEAGLTELADLPAVQAVVLHKNDITPQRATQLHALGKAVVIFGGRSARAVTRVVGVGPEAYQVDNVRQLRAALRR